MSSALTIGFLGIVLLAGTVCAYVSARDSLKARKNPSDSDTDADRMVDYCGIVVVDPRDFRDAAGTCPVSPGTCGVGGNGDSSFHSSGDS